MAGTTVFIDKQKPKQKQKQKPERILLNTVIEFIVSELMNSSGVLKPDSPEEQQIAINKMKDALFANVHFNKNNPVLRPFLVVFDMDRTFAKIGQVGIVYALDDREAKQIFKHDNRIQQRTAEITVIDLLKQPDTWYYYEPKKA